MIKHNTTYFKKYNNIVIYIGKPTISNIERILSIINKYSKFVSLDNVLSFSKGLINSNISDMYIRIAFNYNNLSFDDMSKLKENDKRYKYKTGKIFNLNELYIVDMLLKTGEILPDYTPRRKR